MSHYESCFAFSCSFFQQKSKPKLGAICCSLDDVGGLEHGHELVDLAMRFFHGKQRRLGGPKTVRTFTMSWYQPEKELLLEEPEKGGRKPASVSWGLLVEVLKVLILGDVVVACFGFYVLKRTWGESNPTVTKLTSGT